MMYYISIYTETMNILIFSLLGFSYIYNTVLYCFKTYYKDNSGFFQIKHESNIDLLQNLIERKYYENGVQSTQHYYVLDTPEHIRSSINITQLEVLNRLNVHISNQYINIPEIDEIYFSAKTTKNSDHSFTNLHTDSPFHFCHTLRVLVCIHPTSNVMTHIPEYGFNITLQKYDVLYFDYANTLHFITISPFDDEIQNSRVVLKLHYAKSEICQTLTRRYTRWARSLYVHNLDFLNQYGYIMLASQFACAYMGYGLLFFYSVLAMYYTNKELRSSLMPFLYILIVLTFYQIGFQMYFVVVEPDV